MHGELRRLSEGNFFRLVNGGAFSNPKELGRSCGVKDELSDPVYEATEMSAWKYKQLTAKILVNKFKLIQQKDLIDLIGKPRDQICSLLAKSPYQKELSEISADQINPFSIEDALLRNFARILDEIGRSSPKSIRYLLDATLLKFEADNVKTILRARSAGVDPNEVTRYITPVGSLDAVKYLETMKSSKDVPGIVQLLSSSQYGPALAE